MANHNDMWYESGRAARYGCEPGTDESDAAESRILILPIIQV